MTVQTLAIIVLLVSFFVMIFLRFPIAYAVGLSSVLCMMVQGQALTDVCRLMVKGISSFSLMAVPFFITMGVLMGSGGISEKLIALADACVGWMRGGMAMVNIVASYFFGGISGSASADTASIGSIMIPMMVDQGYDADFSTAVTITSSCEGLLVPPSHNMVIYATTAGGISVGSLFLAGYLPGALLAIVLMIGSYIISVKENYPKGSPFSIKGFVKQLGTSIWALAAVIIVVFGVVGGVFTATESAAIAVIYSLFVSVFVYKGLDWKGVWHALDECVNTLSIVLILIATSAVFGNCLTMLHVPDLAANAITSVTDNPYIIALLIDLIILVLGCIMDMAPIILIATPILLPIATSIGIDPILMIGSYIISVKENYPKGSPFSIKGFVKQLGTSIWALAAVIIVVFGVVGGVFTATESAAIAVIYSLFVSVFVYKGLDWKGVWHALDECVNTLSIVLILIATSAVFGNCLTMLHVPDLAANAITSVTDNPYIIALLIDLIILVLGCIMDMAPIILIATPILLPIATSIGIDPIQFGIIVVLNCGIGLLTPPVGAVLFIGSAVAKRPMEKVVKATLPFYLCMFVALLLLTFIPDISLAIPKLLGGYVSPITNPLGPVFIH